MTSTLFGQIAWLAGTVCFGVAAGWVLASTAPERLNPVQRLSLGVVLGASATLLLLACGDQMGFY